MSELVGTSAPNITALPLIDIEKGLESGSIDVGMCGLFVTESRLLRYDFTNPFYFATGLQAVIKLRALEPSALFIVMQLVGCIDGKTLLILILLLISVIVFGHLMSITDCWLHDKPIFRKSYFETVQDGIWLAFIMLSTIGFGDIVPKSLGARMLAIIWMFISIGLMAIIYAIMTSNFGSMNLQMLGDLEQIQGIKDLAAFSVGSTLSPTGPEFRGRFISKQFRTYPSHEALFQAFLKDEIQVVVERQEIVTYYNTMKADYVSKMLPVGPVFNSDGVGFGVRRTSEVAPHPLLNLLSLAVADATRTSWQSEDTTRKLWFGEAVAVGVDPETLHAMSNGGYMSVLVVLEYVLAAAFGFWFVVSFLEFSWRYPKYKARNDVCAVVRDCLGMAPHGSLKDKMITASMRHDQVRMGLSKLVRVMRSKTELQGKFDSALATPRPEGGGIDGDDDKAPRLGTRPSRRPSREDGSFRSEMDMLFDLDAFATHVAGVMAREQRAGSASVLRSTGRMFLGRCWEWVSAHNYSTRGPELVRGLFLASYSTVIDDSDGFGTVTTQCELQTAEVTVLHLLAQEERHWFREGSLMFAFRSSGDDGGSDREQNQLLRVVNTILEKQVEVLALCDRPADVDSEGPPGPKEAPANGDRHPSLTNGNGSSSNATVSATPAVLHKTQATHATQTDLVKEPQVPARGGRGVDSAAAGSSQAASLVSPKLDLKMTEASRPLPTLRSALNGSDAVHGDENGHSATVEKNSGGGEDVLRSLYPAAFPTVIPPGSTAGYNYSMKAPIHYSSLSAKSLLGESPDSTSHWGTTTATSPRIPVRSPPQQGESL